jgi:purine nucleosidase/pyrimidine-specific ribonucleoside hydrolase
MAQKVVLDTDIGDDIDDALALGLILASWELELVGVTTVFKNTVARARQARTILKVAGRGNVPVAAGCGAVLSPRTTLGFDPRQAYLEGELPNQDASCLPEAELPAPEKRHAVDFLIDTILGGRGDITVLTIGAMTNVAMAIIKEPRILAKLPRIVSMAGTFDRLASEWNIKCDPVAAATLMASKVPMRIIGLDVTTKVQFREEHIQALNACQRPLAQNLSRAIRMWAQHSGWAQHIRGLPVMHDPLAAATLFKPDLVRWRRGTASVELYGDKTYGFTTFQEDPSGPHEYAYEVDAEAALSLWMSKVLAYY